MSESDLRPTEPAEPEPTDDQAIENCINWLQQQQHQRPPGMHRSPLLFPTLVDFPGLIEPTITNIFQNCHIRSTYLSCLRSTASQKAIEADKKKSEESATVIVTKEGGANNDSLVESRSSILEETWSTFMRRLQGNPTFSDVDPMDALYLQHYRWPGKRCRNPSIGSISLSALSANNVIYEKQVITTELDAFITALQQDKKNADKLDKDSLEFAEERKRSQRGGIYFILTFLGLIFAGNLIGGIYQIMKS